MLFSHTHDQLLAQFLKGTPSMAFMHRKCLVQQTDTQTDKSETKNNILRREEDIRLEIYTVNKVINFM